MSGLGTRSNAQRTFVNLVNGKFAVRVKEGTEGAVTRQNANKVTVHELLYDTLEGRIKSVEKEVGDKFVNWKIDFEVGDEIYVLSLPYSGRATNSILHRLPNVDFTKDVLLEAYFFTGDEKGRLYEKPRTYVGVKQAGEKVPPYFVLDPTTKTYSNGLPELEKVFRGGKETWDDSKQMLHLEKTLEELVYPKIAELRKAPAIDKSKLEEPDHNEFMSTNDFDADGATDDLPF